MDILCDAMKDDALVISTLVNSQLSVAMSMSAKNRASFFWILMHPFLKSFQKKQGLDQSKSPSNIHRLDGMIIFRSFSVRFAVKIYDDGKRLYRRFFLDANLILLGVFPYYKTPLIVFSSQQGL